MVQMQGDGCDKICATHQLSYRSCQGLSGLLSGMDQSIEERSMEEDVLALII